MPLGPRAGRALDRAAHGRGGLRAGRRGPRAATTRSCWTSWATCCSRSTSWRCCSRSAGRATSRRWPTTAAQKLIRRHPHVFGERARPRPPRDGACATGTRSSARTSAAGTSFGDLPENLPATALRHEGPAARRERGFEDASRARLGSRQGGSERLAGDGELRRSASCCSTSVERPRELSVDPELALRLRAVRSRRRQTDQETAIIERDRAGPRPPDPRQPRQPDRRGRGRCCDSGAAGRAAVPSGASTGEFEAVELRDGGERLGRQGRHARRSANVNGELAEAVRGARRRRPGRRSTAR